MNPNNQPRKPGGFSLVEMLVVIAVIGIIAAMAAVSLSNTHRNSRVVAAKSNAQRIASTFGAGQAAGAPGFIAAGDLASAMDAVGTGSNGAGINQSSYFMVPGASSTMHNELPPAERPSHYLTWDSGNLIYNPQGVTAENNPWRHLIIIPTPQAEAYVANQNAMHPQNEHRAVRLGNSSLSAIQYRARA